MAITPNRDALKRLASFAIDAQFCQQYGAQVFHYAGNSTLSYQYLCATLLQLIDQMVADLAAMKEQIPVFDVTQGKQEQA